MVEGSLNFLSDPCELQPTGPAVPEYSDDKALDPVSAENPTVDIPDWDDFRVLLVVVRAGSFTRAADELGTTQPTVSRRIARLETIMRAQLVDRTNNGAALTLDGQRIMEELNISHDAFQRAVLRSRARRQQCYDVKLAITDGLASYWSKFHSSAVLQWGWLIRVRRVGKRNLSDCRDRLQQDLRTTRLRTGLGGLDRAAGTVRVKMEMRLMKCT